MISGDNGFRVEKSIVLGSGCSLVHVSFAETMASFVEVSRELWALNRREHFFRLLQRWLWLRLLDFLLLGHTFVIAVVVFGFGIHAGWLFVNMAREQV